MVAIQTGEIKRLLNLDHLGLVRRAIPGAGHPRWEYVTLILSLLDLIRKNVPEAHISSGVTLQSGTRMSSGQELLKCWALLLNVGHLPWTFTTEKAFLAVTTDISIRQKFTNTVRRGRLRNYSKTVLLKQDVYAVHQAIAASRLRSYEDKQPLAELWQDFLQAYCNTGPENAKVTSLVALFRKVRSLAYMMLDPTYTPALVGVNISDILSDPRSLASILFYSEKQFGRLISALQYHLYDRIYLSPEVCRHAAGVARALEKEIQREIETSGIRPTVDKLIAGEIQNRIVSDADDLRTVLRLPLRMDEQVARVLLWDAAPITEEKRWYLSPERTRFNVWPYPDKKQKVIHVFVTKTSDAKETAAVIAHGMLQMAKHLKQQFLFHEGNMPHELLRPVFEDLTLSVVESALREIFDARLMWEFKAWQYAEEVKALFSSRRGHLIGRVIQESLKIRNKSKLASHFSEIQALADALKRAPDHHIYAAVMCSTVAHDEKGVTLAEFDGIYLASNGESLSLTIVESKDVSKRAQSTVNRQIRGAMSKLAIRAPWNSTAGKIVRRPGVPPYALNHITLT